MQATNGKPAEQKLIRLYMDLTGEPEAAARAVADGGRDAGFSDSLSLSRGHRG